MQHHPDPTTGDERALLVPVVDPAQVSEAEIEPVADTVAYREPDGAWVAGISTGLSQHLGWPLWIIRAGFVGLGMVQFLGVFVYGLLWVLLPKKPEATLAPGLESAARTGKRKPKQKLAPRDVGGVSAIVLLGAGAAWLTQVIGFGLPARVFWPLAFAAAGVALVWKQADSEGAVVPAGTNRWIAPFVTHGGRTAAARLGLGVGLLGIALAVIIGSQIGVAQLPTLLTLSLLIVGAIAVVAAPWLYRWRRNMRSGHEQKLLADARADMAAHLHDSVLQTLALIQRQAEDPKAVQALARRQERELRGWLYGESDDPTQLKVALTQAAQEIEDERGVPIEVVCVGDAAMTPALQALVSAAREAMMNAAKHSGAPKIDVYAEVEDDTAQVFVRDRGNGFAMETIEDDRMGVKGSIIARMERHGGTAVVRSAPGEGTDIKLEMTTEEER